MHLHHTVTLFSLLLGASTAAAAASSEPARNCGFKIAACPKDQYCKPNDPTCTRGENCLGKCVHSSPSPSSTLATVTTTKTKPSPTPKPRETYPPCGGFRVAGGFDCGKGFVCVDNPYVKGCGMACDRPGICVPDESCGGFIGKRCQDANKECFDDPRDDCDPKNGG